jgi:hypothetical protein
MLSPVVILIIVALLFVVASALGKLPDWPWGLVLCIVLLLITLGAG